MADGLYVVGLVTWRPDLVFVGAAADFDSESLSEPRELSSELLLLLPPRFRRPARAPPPLPPPPLARRCCFAGDGPVGAGGALGFPRAFRPADSLRMALMPAAGDLVVETGAADVDADDGGAVRVEERAAGFGGAGICIVIPTLVLIRARSCLLVSSYVCLFFFFVVVVVLLCVVLGGCCF